MGQQLRNNRSGWFYRSQSEERRISDTKSHQSEHINELKKELNDLADGDEVFSDPQNLSLDAQESNLEDILAFESVGSGPSLFEGLKMHGMELPFPGKLDEKQSARKVMEILRALGALRIFLIGFEEMTACELYSTLWNQTLWEGCYVKKRDPYAMTLIDVSHKMMRSDMVQFLESMTKANSVH
jgi:hypothetical protein